MPTTQFRPRLPGRLAPLAITTAMLAAVVMVAPVAAGGPVGSPPYGSEFSCMSKTVVKGGYTFMRLKKIKITPPEGLYAETKSQKVGWRIVLQRRVGDQLENVKWKRIAVRSQKVLATTGTWAVFKPMQFKIKKVNVLDKWPNGKSTEFRLKVRVTWYKPNKPKKVAHREVFTPAHYQAFRDGVFQWTEDGVCQGAWVFDN